MPSAVGDRAWVGPWRQLAKDEAAQYTELAIDALSKAEEAIGGEAVQEARELLEADPPSSQTAARALMLIGAHAAGGHTRSGRDVSNSCSWRGRLEQAPLVLRRLQAAVGPWPRWCSSACCSRVSPSSCRNVA